MTIELRGAEGTKQIHEVARGGDNDPHSTFDPVGLTLDDGKALLAYISTEIEGHRMNYTAERSWHRCPRRADDAGK